MRIDKRLLDYVSGATFSELLKADIRQSARPRHRFDVIESLVCSKNIIHVGCIDHLPLLADKIRTGIWFHDHLTRVASRCIGIDINEEGVTRAQVEFGIQNVFCGDVASDPHIAPINEGIWDYLILGEVLEHVDNPVSFLRAIVANYGERIRRIIITVPNAFQAGTLLGSFNNQEWVNSDHRYWFTPYTILKVAARSGLAVEMLELCHLTHGTGIKRQIKNLLLRRFPLFHEDLVAVCSLPVTASSNDEVGSDTAAANFNICGPKLRSS